MPVTNFSQDKDSLYIPLPKEFSFQEVLLYLSRSSIEILHYLEGEKVYKLLHVEEQMILLEISQKDDDTLQIRFVDKKPSSKHAKIYVVQYICEWLDLDTELHQFYDLVKNDKILGTLITRYHGLRIVGIPDLFESLCWAVIGQQINLTFAYTLKRRFVENFGRSYEWNNRSHWIFPEPSQLSDQSIQQLRQLQFTQRKAEYIVGIAKEIVNGNLLKKTMIKDLQKAEQQLLAIRGVGPWTAHYAMMRCFRNPSAFPIGDVGLHNALKHLLLRDEKPKLDEIKKIFMPWKNWEAYAVFYLWRSLEDV
ncbi:DNA-3-methyladenine glycosylase [Shimazuella sp. KC615]|uniref:DNA-3-methyladenine glycosylase II n=2 Tax=Shimazuella alba TaxID=2690964 RepID=A0A6I4VQ04_9BACL|nr:DNA-3-methyladenine glycosylase [Shimazuella alba]